MPRVMESIPVPIHYPPPKASDIISIIGVEESDDGPQGVGARESSGSTPVSVQERGTRATQLPERVGGFGGFGNSQVRT
jgi:hypothetical protein